jgi:hypothetical protein
MAKDGGDEVNSSSIHAYPIVAVEEQGSERASRNRREEEEISDWQRGHHGGI